MIRSFTEIVGVFERASTDVNDIVIQTVNMQCITP